MCILMEDTTALSGIATQVLYVKTGLVLTGSKGILLMKTNMSGIVPGYGTVLDGKETPVKPGTVLNGV